MNLPAEMLLLLSCCFLCLQCCHCETSAWDREKFKEEASQTFNLVFHKYNPRVRPPDPYISTDVNVSLSHIRHLDLRKQELQTVLDISMMWHDTRLEWYPDKVKEIFVNTSNVWVPDMIFLNSVEQTKLLYPSNVRIVDEGNVYWTKKAVVTTFCPTRLDSQTQNCTISLGFLSNSGFQQMDLFFGNTSSFDSVDDFANHEWRLTREELDFIKDVNSNRTSELDLKLSLEPRTGTDDGASGEVASAETTSDSCGGGDDAHHLKDNRNNGAALHAGGCRDRWAMLGMMMAADVVVVVMMVTGVLTTWAVSESVLTR